MSELRRDFVKVLLLPALTFLLLPLGTVGFAKYGEAKIDGLILSAIEKSINADAQLSAEERAAGNAYYRAHPPSQVCDDLNPDLAKYREQVCGFGDEVWQFNWAERLGWYSAALGVFAFLFIGLLGFIAWRRPPLQYQTFMLGWRGLVAVTALEAIVQGVLAVWLSYWVTALLFEVYIVKLILVVVVLVGMGVWGIVRGLFRALPPAEPLEAEPLTESDAPSLWQRLRQLAARLGTEPPRAIVAGIDDNFFVTEQGLTLASGQALEGRVLYLSLPLLRTLSPSEADAVFSHELAHFQGGDTATSAKLAPALMRYQHYVDSLFDGGITIPAAFVMRLYRAIFEVALRKEQRRRELVADTQAASLTSPDDVGRSLLKVTGYSSYRAHTERELFEHDQTHDSELGLQARIDAGLATHVAAQGFLQAVKTLQVPHPFDTHPPLEERLANVQTQIHVDDVAQVFDAKPTQTWADEILTGADIEQRLWNAYEQRFKANHELSLAYRYLPRSPEEQALVERHFPRRTFVRKDGTELTVNFEYVTLGPDERVAFADITEAKIDDGNFSTTLVLTHVDRATQKEQKTKINLKHLGQHQEAFKNTFGHYWQRAQIAHKTVSNS